MSSTKYISLERNCPDCDEGVVELYFEIQPREPDVGIMRAAAIYDYADTCSSCGSLPYYDDDAVTTLEEEALESLRYPD